MKHMNFLTSDMIIKELQKRVEELESSHDKWQNMYYDKLEKLTEANKLINKLKEENLKLKKKK